MIRHHLLAVFVWCHQFSLISLNFTPFITVHLINQEQPNWGENNFSPVNYHSLSDNVLSLFVLPLPCLLAGTGHQPLPRPVPTVDSRVSRRGHISSCLSVTFLALFGCFVSIPSPLGRVVKVVKSFPTSPFPLSLCQARQRRRRRDCRRVRFYRGDTAPRDLSAKQRSGPRTREFSGKVVNHLGCFFLGSVASIEHIICRADKKESSF